MDSRTPHTALTYEDFVLFPDDGKRHELIEGEHYMTPSPRTKHQRVSIRLSAILENFLREKRTGTVFAAPFDVVLSNIDVIEPDLLYISRERASIITEDNIKGAPDLVVEILSDGTRKTDEVIKRKLYERYGVREYWIIDPALEVVKVYRLEGQCYRRVAELAKETNDALSTPLIPDFQVPLADIFE